MNLFYAFGSCFRMLAVILVSDFFRRFFGSGMRVLFCVPGYILSLWAGACVLPLQQLPVVSTVRAFFSCFESVSAVSVLNLLHP